MSEKVPPDLDERAHERQGGRREVEGIIPQSRDPRIVEGPELAQMVQLLERTAEGLAALYRMARLEAQYRYQSYNVGFESDSNGDGAVLLFEVPQGATGYLMHCAVDEAGVTPATPDTRATLWHAIVAAGGGTPTAAQVKQARALLDCSPVVPTIDTQIPFVYLYGDPKAAPCLVGPQAFYLVVDAANPAVQISARGGVYIEQPEP